MITLTIPPAEVRATVDYRRLIDCIQEVEGHAWEDQCGALGWTWAAWHEDAQGLPYRFARSPEHARTVAERRLLRMSDLLTRLGWSPSVRNLAQVWRSGLSGVTRGRPVEPGYGRRVENLYYSKP